MFIIMANLKASKRDIRRIKKRTDRNKPRKTRIRNLEKKIYELVQGIETEKLSATYREYVSYLDKAKKTRLIHRKKADRKKSRLALFINKHVNKEPKEQKEEVTAVAE